MGFASGFNAGYSAVKDAVESREKKKREEEVKASLKAGLDSAKADSTASGRSLLDKGQDDPDTPDYQYANKEEAASAAATLGDVDSMQAEIDAEKAPSAVAAATPTTPVPAQPGDPGLAALTARAPAPQMSAAPSATPGLERAPAPAPAAAPAPEAAPAQGWTQTDRQPQNQMDIFHKKYAPQVVETLMKQGNLEGAQKFEAWSASAQGSAYGSEWLKAVAAEQSGDHHGAIKSVVGLYNKQLPDGEYAVAVPSKDGKEYKIQIRDEKTNKLVKEMKGATPSFAQAAVGMMSPANAFKYLDDEATKESNTKATLAKEEREQANKIELERVKGQYGGTPSDTLKRENEIAEISKANPNDPRLPGLRAALHKSTTHAPAASISNYTTSTVPLAGGGLGRLTKDGGPPVPIEGAANPVQVAIDKAENSLAGVARRVDPPSPDNPSPTPYYLRNGEKIPAFVRGKPNPEYAQIQEHTATLRAAGKAPPWERKPAPGLSR